MPIYFYIWRDHDEVHWAVSDAETMQHVVDNNPNHRYLTAEEFERDPLLRTTEYFPERTIFVVKGEVIVPEVVQVVTKRLLK